MGNYIMKYFEAMEDKREPWKIKVLPMIPS